MTIGRPIVAYPGVWAGASILLLRRVCRLKVCLSQGHLAFPLRPEGIWSEVS